MKETTITYLSNEFPKKCWKMTPAPDLGIVLREGRDGEGEGRGPHRAGTQGGTASGRRLWGMGSNGYGVQCWQTDYEGVTFLWMICVIPDPATLHGWIWKCWQLPQSTTPHPLHTQYHYVKMMIYGLQEGNGNLIFRRKWEPCISTCVIIHKVRIWDSKRLWI